ncbi:hypothetical protein V6N13_116687 [Hibiscus sabdariffa]
MSGAANDSTTKFPISGKVPLEWLMHRLASLNPGHAQSVGVFVTPGRPTTRGFGLVDARSRWLCATCLDNVTPNTGSPCVATVQLGGVSRPSNVRASARPMSHLVDLNRARCPECVDRHDSTTSVHRCSIVLLDAENLVSVGSRPRSLVACAFGCGTDVAKECYLVDPASSHMIVSKIKPCMFGPRGGSAGPPHGEHRFARPYCRRCAPGLNWSGRSSGAVCDALRYSGPHARYTDVFNESIALADRPGKSLKFHRDGDRSLQLLVFNEEFLVSASHPLALTTSLPFVHTTRRSYRLNGPVKCSDRGDVGGSLPATSREVH